MGQYRQRQIRELSGGQQQRVFLARAIAQEADLLLLDEPFNNVDRQTETIIFDIFAELKAQQKTLLVISHDLSETFNRAYNKNKYFPPQPLTINHPINVNLVN